MCPIAMPPPKPLCGPLGGEVEALMKGLLHTDELMSEVVARETGLRASRRLSHVFMADVPTYLHPC